MPNPPQREADKSELIRLRRTKVPNPPKADKSSGIARAA